MLKNSFITGGTIKNNMLELARFIADNFYDLPEGVGIDELINGNFSQNIYDFYLNNKESIMNLSRELSNENNNVNESFYPLFEKDINYKKETTDVKGQIERSKTIPQEIKDKIIPLIIKDGIHRTKYNNGVVTRLKIPKIKGKSFNGVDLGADKNGFFVFTHRARSKSKPEIYKISDKDIKFIESTG